MAKLHKPRFVLAYPLALVLLLFAHTTERLLRVGIGLIVIGACIRLWANSYVGHVKVNARRGDRKIGLLVTAGPYAYVRHPLYLGSFLIGGGFCFIAGNPWIGAAALAFFLVVYRRKMAEEEALLSAEIGTPYLLYQGAVPRWLPTGRAYPNPQGSWSRQGLLASKEWKTLIWIVVAVLALYFREEIFQEHEWSLKQMVLLAIACGLMLTDGAVELRRLWKRRIKPAQAIG